MINSHAPEWSATHHTLLLFIAFRNIDYFLGIIISSIWLLLTTKYKVRGELFLFSRQEFVRGEILSKNKETKNIGKRKYFPLNRIRKQTYRYISLVTWV